MGGSASRGNKGVMSEFNIATDPEAAKIVFDSGVPIVMAGLDVGWKALVMPEDTEKLLGLGEVGKMAHCLFKCMTAAQLHIFYVQNCLLLRKLMWMWNLPEQ